MKPSNTNKDISDEVVSLINKIQAINEEIKRGIPNFKNNYKDCNRVSEFQGTGLENPQYLKLICERGYDYFKEDIVDPLLTSLLDYNDHLNKTKAYTGNAYKTKMMGLISSIHRYVVVSSFFGKNPDYMVPGYGTDEIKTQNEFKKIILVTNKRLMGCDDIDPKFPIQTIVKKLGMEGDHKKIIEYMDTQCVLLRKELLK